jgi:hypothetical protein
MCAVSTHHRFILLPILLQQIYLLLIAYSFGVITHSFGHIIYLLLVAVKLSDGVGTVLYVEMLLCLYLASAAFHTHWAAAMVQVCCIIAFLHLEVEIFINPYFFLSTGMDPS